MVIRPWKTPTIREDLKALSFFVVMIKLSNQHMVKVTYEVKFMERKICLTLVKSNFSSM